MSVVKAGAVEVEEVEAAAEELVAATRTRQEKVEKSESRAITASLGVIASLQIAVVEPCWKSST